MNTVPGALLCDFRAVTDMREDRAYLLYFVVVIQSYDPLAHRATGNRNESDLVWVEIR